jgi:lipoprotein-releasing system ATP-binding protein
MILIENLHYKHLGAEFPIHYPNMHASVESPLLITGKSGCGKSTLLHIITGLLRQYNGSVVINNTNIALLSNKQLDAFRGSNIGIIFQQHFFIQSLTVKDNIAIAACTKPLNLNFLMQLATTLGIENLLKKFTHQLSIGEQQRVAIAKALINKPSIIIADEPTSSLDNENATRVIELLLQQAKDNNACIIVVTHDDRIKHLFTNSINII